jgi:hypothetical protein
MMRALKYFGFEYSPLFYQLEIVIVANKDISSDKLRAQTCLCLGIDIPATTKMSAKKSSKKRKSPTKVSSRKKKSTKTEHKVDTQQMARISSFAMGSPIVQAAIASAVQAAVASAVQVAMSPRAAQAHHVQQPTDGQKAATGDTPN